MTNKTGGWGGPTNGRLEKRYKFVAELLPQTRLADLLAQKQPTHI